MPGESPKAQDVGQRAVRQPPDQRVADNVFHHAAPKYKTCGKRFDIALRFGLKGRVSASVHKAGKLKHPPRRATINAPAIL